MKKILRVLVMAFLLVQPINIFAVQREKPRIIGTSNKMIPEGYSIDLLENVVVLDDQDGDITHKLEVTPRRIDSSVPGKHIVIYSVIDSDGNIERVSVQVEVLKDKTEINIVDENLRARINRYLGQDINDPVTIQQAQTITEMDISKRNITDLEGLQYFNKLEILDLSNNEIKDINVLSHITTLRNLNLSNNQIKNVEPMANLIYLSILDLSNNQISNIDPISTFQGIKLKLYGQKIYLDETYDDKNDTVKIDNPIFDENGRPIVPYDVETYEEATNKLIWTNITKDMDVTFRFTKGFKIGDTSTVFKGDVYLPIKNLYFTANTGLSDVSENHWAKDAIDLFVARGFMGGYSDNTFRPDNKITRAEFIKVFNRYFGFTEGTGIVFNDTKNHWAKNDIDIAVSMGVVNGMNSNEFWPDEFITREQAAVIISNYKKNSNKEHYLINKYADGNQISSWAKSAVEGVVIDGYMGGYSDNTFKPKRHMTRAEAVSMLSRME